MEAGKITLPPSPFSPSTPAFIQGQASRGLEVGEGRSGCRECYQPAEGLWPSFYLRKLLSLMLTAPAFKDLKLMGTPLPWTTHRARFSDLCFTDGKAKPGGLPLSWAGLSRAARSSEPQTLTPGTEPQRRTLKPQVCCSRTDPENNKVLHVDLSHDLMAHIPCPLLLEGGKHDRKEGAASFQLPPQWYFQYHIRELFKLAERWKEKSLLYNRTEPDATPLIAFPS